MEIATVDCVYDQDAMQEMTTVSDQMKVLNNRIDFLQNFVGNENKETNLEVLCAIRTIEMQIRALKQLPLMMVIESW